MIGVESLHVDELPPASDREDIPDTECTPTDYNTLSRTTGIKRYRVTLTVKRLPILVTERWAWS